ncbi:hypothetical protein ACFLU3_05950 [Chloroflexota bacterium]
MTFEIQPNTLIRTECGENPRCLAGKEEIRCAVIKLAIGAGLFVNFKPDVPCSYLMKFGTGTICNCPIRKEIYEQYAV